MSPEYFNYMSFMDKMLTAIQLTGNKDIVDMLVSQDACRDSHASGIMSSIAIASAADYNIESLSKYAFE